MFNKTLFRTAMLLLLAVILAGCATQAAPPIQETGEPISAKEILNLVLDSHNHWTTVEGTAQTVWHVDGQSDQAYKTAFTFELPDKGKFTLLEVPPNTHRITWISDGTQIFEIDLDAGTQTWNKLPDFATDTSKLPATIAEVDPEYLYRHPFGMLVPSPVAENIFPHGFAQRVGKGDYTLIGEDQIAGRDTWVITLTIRETLTTAWIDKQTGVILKRVTERTTPEMIFEVLSIRFDAGLEADALQIPAAQSAPDEDWRILARGDNGIILLQEPGQDEPLVIQLPDQSSGLSLSPIGDRIAYWHIYWVEIYDLTTGEITRVGTEEHGSYGLQTVWSPDEKSIAVGCASKTNPSIGVCLFDVDSGEMQILTDLTSYSSDPFTSVDTSSWSAEANLLAFRLSFPQISGDSFLNLIFVMDMDTYETRLVADERTSSTYSKFNIPRLSPDGTKILLSAEVNAENKEILLIDVATGAITQLTHLPQGQDASNPVWLDNQTFTASVFAAHQKVSQSIYNLSSEVIGVLDIPESWGVQDIQAAD